MTIKVLQRDNCPVSWFVGRQIKWRGEVLELIEINGDEYVWIDVEKTNQKDVQYENKNDNN